MTETLPFGSWPSPLTAAAVSAASPRIDGARFVGDEVWWAQTVPEEGGRTGVRRRRSDGTVDDVLPAPGNARSRVHEYGGGAWTADDDGTLFYVERADQRLYALRSGGERRALTPADASTSYGGLVHTGSGVLAVRETHESEGVPRRAVVLIPRDGSGETDAAALRVLAEGSDFVAQPALSPDGSRLAWVAWDHPDMPWDRTEIRVRALDDPPESFAVVAGGDGRAPLQPVWTGDDELTWLDDPDGRWNLWRGRPGEEPTALAPADADTGGALWVLGARWFAALPDGDLVAVQTNGGDRIVRVGADGTSEVPVPVTAGASIEDARGTRVLVAGAGPEHPGALWLVDAVSDAPPELVAGGAASWGTEWMPRARAVTAPGPHGPVHAFAYAPTHPDLEGPAGELPPCVVLVHGGPTAHTGPAASAKAAYFTSRGIAVLDVNYGGSTGYGRAYRERLRGTWGIVDVDDVAAAATAFAAEGGADPARLAIEGGSAGGWTVLGALVGTDVFAAGISRYGVADARALAAETHDFEARYLDGLIGPLPEAEEEYVRRSPLSRADRFRAPLLILQGADDPVVPPAQAEALRDALVARGVPHAYVVYEGEGHGFRRAETVVHALETELGFLGAVFGFTPPGVAPVVLSH